ncbi:T9SS type B sorting domain-containing protein [Muricauda sp. JGD-17]|uniref:T9SS type B sorting domain-containing protein n=1 Tax=Flagellimonas ochracea TaxID=2696472 RepID=A0A964WXV7_9FLAO|nr:gliding motility-associated C-terminal domain-containing protein [Allomuricauda ochracea]NAY92470.1 T9SS type B sorting domain-containing protein [Allomuricauda ochracea]
MKKLLYIPFLFFAVITNAQNGLYNGSGNIRIHTDGNLGFHTNLINNGPFDQNQGLVGFYGGSALQVLGNTVASFNDIEVMAPGSVILQNAMAVENNMNFVDGDIISSKGDKNIFLNFGDTGFFTGENDDSKVTGFAAITNQDFFSFPVGDVDQLRPLVLESENPPPMALCAYFFEDPSDPPSLLESFNVFEKNREIGNVSNREFWVVESNVPGRVTISWNARSALGGIPNITFESIIAVGWSKVTNRWEIIGNFAQSGDINQGFLTSQTFVPSDYAAITFGTVPLPKDTFAVNNPTLGNYFLSPNGDGVNDFLIIDGMSDSPNNNIQIYNRFGQKVYERNNYVDEFTGTTNTGSLIMSQDIGLPEGIYYYLVSLNDLELQYTGFVFLDR